MDIVEKKIISIGGGGFTHQTDKFLDEFVINQIIDRKIKFGFLIINYQRIAADAHV